MRNKIASGSVVRRSNIGKLLCAASAFVLAGSIGGSAFGQAAPADQTAANIETVTVTSTRIEGYSAPTPVTAVSAEQIQQQAPTTVADVLTTIPSFRPDSTPTTSGVNSLGGGQITADLRGLGATRTLVLVNGKRFQPVSADGNPDLTQIPTLLVDRVEVVTGGASAAYGSDAVAGVVNFILKKQVKGFQGTFQYGRSQYGDDIEQQGAFAFGDTAFADKFNFMVGVNYINNEGIGGQYTRPWGREEVGLITNSAFKTNGLPNFIIAPRDHTSNESNGGLIIGATTKTGAKSTALNGIAFGPGGTPYNFNFGQVFGTSMIGGEQQEPNPTLNSLLGKPFTATSGLAHADYAITPDINAFIDISAARTTAGGASQQSRDTGLVIQSDNAFLPQSIKNTMAADNLASITIGRYYDDIGLIKLHTQNKTGRVIAGVQGTVFGDWTWDADYQFGENRYFLNFGPNNRNQANFKLAADAVVNPATGSIVCRSTLTNPANGCIPVDVFGDGSAKVNTFAYGSATYKLVMDQTVADMDLNGSPFSTWAGAVSIASGLEYRREAARATADPVSTQVNPDGSTGGWALGDQKNFAGAYNIYEGYLETVVPLAKDMPWAEEADINAAARVTSYSTAGGTTTWKVGFNYQPIDDLRFRGTRSHDVRAPNLSELFQGGTGSSFTQINDPVVGVVQVRQVGEGNTSLKPEKAETWTGGFVYQPGWLSGFATSVDYWNIKVAGVISMIGAPTTLAGCEAGNQLFCKSIVFNPNGSVNFIISQALNLNELKTSGVDIESSYTLDEGTLGIPGQFGFHVLGTYVDQDTTILPGNIVQNTIGQVSGFNRVSGVPKWQGDATINWSMNPWAANLRARYIGAGVFNPNFTTGAGAANTISNNYVGAFVYFDIGGSYSFDAWGLHAQLFGTIQNLFNKAPAFVPSQAAGGTNESSTNTVFYDPIGRLYKVGLRFQTN